MLMNILLKVSCLLVVTVTGARGTDTDPKQFVNTENTFTTRHRLRDSRKWEK